MMQQLHFSHRYERMWEPEVFSQLLRLACGHLKSPEEIEVMTEVFSRGRRQRMSEVGFRRGG